MSFYLKLLLPNFIKNTLFEYLPMEIIEYIIKKFIIMPDFKSIVNNYDFMVENIKYRFYYIWKNYYKIVLKLQIFNIQNVNLDYRNIINKCVHDHDYILHLLKHCNCCKNHTNLQTNSLYYNNHENTCVCSCQVIIRCICNAKIIAI